MFGVVDISRKTRFFESNKEEPLIKKAIKGDGRAFEKIMDKHIDLLYKIAYLHLKNQEKSLDAIQECSYRGFKHINKLKDIDNFKPWIVKILTNICIDTIKKDNKIIYLDEENPLVMEEEKSISLEEKLDLYDAIDKLKPEYRTVIILKYFNDFTIKRIGEIIDVNENTVKTRLSRAKKILSELLKEEV